MVPAQPKARPEGQRPIGMPLAPRPNFFRPSLKLNEPIACVFRTILGQERRQVDQKDEPQSIFLTKLLQANRISAETPTSAPPPKQNICRQIAEGIASWVTPWTSAQPAMAAGAAKTSATMRRRVGDRSVANKTANAPNAAAAAKRPMKLAPIRPEPL